MERGYLTPKTKRIPPLSQKEIHRIHIDSDPVSRLLWEVNRGYCRIMHRFFWAGIDPLPRTGPAILVCNHQSSVDPFILAATTRRMISFLIADEYYHTPGFRLLFERMGCIPVKRNQQDIAATRKALKALKQGKLLGIFPEGGIEKGDQDLQLGVGYLSLKYKAPVIPAYVYGTPTGHTVRRAMFAPSRSYVLFGPPCLPPADLSGSPERPQIAEWTASIMKAVNDLAS